jgi:DNA-binding NarL/FixJ family response regulator
MPPEPAPHVVLVDDHELLAHSLGIVLEARGIRVSIVDPATPGLVAAVADVAPDLVLLDLELGAGLDGAELVAPLTAAGTPVVVVTGSSDPVRLGACVHAGAVGVLHKSSSFDELVTAAQRTLQQGTAFTGHERDELLRRHRLAVAATDRRLAPFRALTARESEVLGALVRGSSVEQIAHDATVTVATVRSQVRAILTKLDAPSQLVAVARAREAGWVPPQERRCPPECW